MLIIEFIHFLEDVVTFFLHRYIDLSYMSVDWQVEQNAARVVFQQTKPVLGLFLVVGHIIADIYEIFFHLDFAEILFVLCDLQEIDMDFVFVALLLV